jgi:Glycosyl transferase family 2
MPSPFVIGIPRCNPPEDLFAETLAGIAQSVCTPIKCFIVDNGDAPLGAIDGFEVIRPATNVGCAGGWNIVLRHAFDALKVPTAILLNDDCAVSPDTFGRMLDSSAGVVCAQGFSCFRIDAAVWHQVGPFDEEFYPAYWEDTDYRRRLNLAGLCIDEWPSVPVAMPSVGRTTYSSGVTHGKFEPDAYQSWRGARLARFHAQVEANHQRYVMKWGGEPGRETFTTPFGEKP